MLHVKMRVSHTVTAELQLGTTGLAALRDETSMIVKFAVCTELYNVSHPQRRYQ